MAPGAEGAATDFCIEETRKAGSYQRAVDRLIALKRYDEAKELASQGLQNTDPAYAGLINRLQDSLATIAARSKDHSVAVAIAAERFVARPGVSSFEELLNVARRAKCEAATKAVAMNFLETGKRPTFTKPSKSRANKKKAAKSRADRWPFPAPPSASDSNSRLDRGHAKKPSPHFDVVIRLSIEQRNPESILRWYDEWQASGPRNRLRLSRVETEVADAVSSTHPDRAVELYCTEADRLAAETNCTRSQVHLSTELPVLAPCEWTGRGLASEPVKQGNDEHDVSLDVAQRHNAAKQAENWTTKDIANLLSATTKLKPLGRVQELGQLVGNGYLALLHADGNSVGSGADKTDSDEARAKNADFFHSNRVLLRRAVKKAIDAHSPDTGIAPLIPLMLGGDDLLLVCRAKIALPFVVTLCQALDKLQRDNAGFKLTLGVGVVFAKHTIPIHRLHEVAEQLASSAKRRFRGLVEASDAKRSVVDWAVFSTAWVDDPDEVRRRDWLRDSGNELRVLSQRPVDVLGQDIDSLQGLVRGAAQLEHAPRSQLRDLVDQLPRGRVLSELAFVELPQEAKEPLAETGVTTPWRRAANNGPWLTAVLDLVEITEIARLGRNTERAITKQEVVHV